MPGQADDPVRAAPCCTCKRYIRWPCTWHFTQHTKPVQQTEHVASKAMHNSSQDGSDQRGGEISYVTYSPKTRESGRAK